MKQDVIVIGAGIIGLTTAEHLLTKGAAVTILERGKVGQESSWAGGGVLAPLCPWHYPSEVTCLTDYSAKLFPNWIAALHKATGIDAELKISGMLILPEFDKQIALQWCAAHNVTIETTKVTYPFNSSPEFNANKQQTHVDTLFLPNVAQVRNPCLLQALQKRVTALGGKIIENCAVCEIKTSKNTVQGAVIAAETVKADHYVITAGAWSQALLGRHAMNLDIKPARGQILLFKFASPPFCHILLQDDLYLIPRNDGHLLVGSTIEYVGFNKETTIAARHDLLQRAQKLLPDLRNLPIKKQWAGLRPASPHNIPTIGRHPLINNLYINSGHFRYGVTMAPASAEILFNEMTGSPQPLDTTAYRWAEVTSDTTTNCANGS